MGQILLETQNLSKRFCRRPEMALRYTVRDIFREFRRQADGGDYLRAGEFWALRDINLQVRAGEVVGIIGHNGAGKSTLINLVMGILRPTLGQVIHYTERVVLIDNQAALSPIQTGRENIYNKLSLHGFSQRQIEKVVDEIIEYSDIGESINAPVGNYSTGMRLRLAFSIYTQMRPDIFIVDEALGGGDIRFRQKFLNYLQQYIAGGGAILLVSHELFIVQNLCHRCLLLEQGQVKHAGSPEEIIHAYQELMQEKEGESLREKHLTSQIARDKIDLFAPAQQLVSNDAIINSELFGSVQIEKIEICAFDGSQPKTLDSVRLCIICNSQIEIGPVVIYLEIGINEIFPLAVIFGGASDRDYNLVKGHNQFCCTVDKLPLLPGNYKLRLYVAHRERRMLLGGKGIEDSLFSFEVKGYANIALNAAIHSKSLIYLPSNWE